MRDFEVPGRSTVHALNGMAATSHPLATGVAVDILKAGGSALDAAIAASATLAVVEPQSTGIGGDCFALLAPGGSDQVVGFNGSGRSPAAATLEHFQSLGMAAIPPDSVHAVTLPGAVDAWFQLHAEHGKLDFRQLMAPAVRYARDGYPVHARVRYDWLRAKSLLEKREASAQLFLPGGAVPQEGDVHRQPALGDTLEALGREGRTGFYEGPIAQRMVKALRAEGGLHTEADFAAVRGNAVTPIRTDYRGHTVHQIPPNNQGLTALILLNILEGFDLGAQHPLSALRTHWEIEAGRLAYAARDAAIAEESHMAASLDRLLSKDWAATLRKQINPDRAIATLPALDLAKSDTVYVSVVDRDRNAVSFINSTFWSFGSGLLDPETGVIFQNRGTAFRLDPAHPNRIGPSKRPLHTIMPGMVTKDGRAEISYGVMGGDYQPFGHARFLTNRIDYGMDLQASLDMPRVFAMNAQVEIERSFPPETIRGLQERGHALFLAPEPLGGGQAVAIDHARGVLSGASDPRKDGCALGY